MDVQFAGMELDSWQIDEVNGYSDKLGTECDVDTLHIDIKQHEKAGGRASYTTHLRAKSRGGIFTAEVTDWEFHMSVKNAFSKLMNEIRKVQELKR